MQTEIRQTDRPSQPDTGVPPGFRPYERHSPYFSALGPLYIREDESGGLIMALRVEGKHLNMGGVAHGGMLLTFADGAMSANLALARVPRQRSVTVSLSSEFLASTRAGDWLEAHVMLRKIGGKLAFGDCELRVGERRILHASAVFSTVGEPSSDAHSDG